MDDAMISLLHLITAFAPVLVAVAIALVLECVAPWRAGWRRDGLGWLQVGVIYVLGTLLVRLVLPFSLVSASHFAAETQIGLFNLVEVGLWLAIPVTVLAIDLGDYLRHRLEHRFAALWRIHRLHHLQTAGGPRVRHLPGHHHRALLILIRGHPTGEPLQLHPIVTSDLHGARMQHLGPQTGQLQHLPTGDLLQ